MFHDDFHDGDDRDGLSPEERLRLVADIWCEIDGEDSGATDWVALDELRLEVTEAMVRRDVDLAESLTCRAFFLISGIS
jgi:hypothetical protein